MLELIDRSLHSERPIDVANLQALLDFQLRVEAHQAEIDFNAAKGRILEKLADIRIVKTKSVSYDKGQTEAFKYVPLEELDKHLAPLLAAEKMDLAYSQEQREGAGMLVRGRLKHLPGGHYEDSFMAAPFDNSGGKNPVQGVGSSNSYLRRYIACNIFNIVVVGDDDDGMGGYIDEAQAEHIRELIATVAAADPKKDEAAFCKYLRVRSVEELLFKDYRKATSVLGERISKIEAASGDLS
jgi:hypothetical protein